MSLTSLHLLRDKFALFVTKPSGNIEEGVSYTRDVSPPVRRKRSKEYVFRGTV